MAVPDMQTAENPGTASMGQTPMPCDAESIHSIRRVVRRCLAGVVPARDRRDGRRRTRFAPRHPSGWAAGGFVRPRKQAPPGPARQRSSTPPHQFGSGLRTRCRPGGRVQRCRVGANLPSARLSAGSRPGDAGAPRQRPTPLSTYIPFALYLRILDSPAAASPCRL